MANTCVQEKAAVCKRAGDIKQDVLGLSHRIHANPEPAFEEERAAKWLSEWLDQHGFDVRMGVCDLPTAFVATKGRGPLHVGICAEYDCLPGLGHACGHNMIAAMAAGAGMLASRVADYVGLTVSVIGTPAEEIGNASGKILLLERGAFDGINVAMMVHPAPFDIVMPRLVPSESFEVVYTGRESHAGISPERGINANDALTIAQTAIGLIRQTIRSSDRIHGVVTHGGVTANVVPGRSSASYMIRGACTRHLTQLRNKVCRCFEAGAIATGAQMTMIGGDRPYAGMRHNQHVADVYRRNAEARGRVFQTINETTRRWAEPTASSDMGNVSQVIPSIHPSIGIGSFPIGNHEREFTKYCITASADNAVLDGAVAMAWTAIDLAADPASLAHLLRRGPDRSRP